MDDTQNQSELSADAIKLLTAYLSTLSHESREQRFAVVPEGVTVIDFEKYRAAPDRIKASLNFAEVQSFIDYAKEYRTDASKLFYSKNKRGLEFLCELDYHGKDAPKWNTHSARLKMQFHPDYQLFLDNNDKWFEQEEFAIFVEGQTHLFHTPDGATMLELAQDLRGTINSQWRSGKRLSDGQVKMEYIETIEGKVGSANEVLIPEQLKLVMPIYDGHDAQEIKAAFRWRVIKEKSTVLFSYKLLNTQAEREAQEQTKQFIQTETGLTPLGVTEISSR